MALIDIHHHLIYGVDDGAKTLEDTQKMLLRACEQGVTHLVATSHATPGRELFPAEQYIAHFEEAERLCVEQQLPITLHMGAEILYTDEASRILRAGQIPTLANTNVVLVEFLPNVTYDRLCHAARYLGNQGFTVVFAHVERYYEALKDVEHIASLREEYNVWTQMNCNTILRKRGFFFDRWVKRLLAEEYIDIVSSDAHNVTSRPCTLGQCYHTLTQRYGVEMANALCYENAASLLGLN